MRQTSTSNPRCELPHARLLRVCSHRQTTCGPSPTRVGSRIIVPTIPSYKRDEGSVVGHDPIVSNSTGRPLPPPRAATAISPAQSAAAPGPHAAGEQRAHHVPAPAVTGGIRRRNTGPRPSPTIRSFTTSAATEYPPSDPPLSLSQEFRIFLSRKPPVCHCF